MDMIEVIDYRRGAKIPTVRRVKKTQVRGLMRITSEILHCSAYVGYAHDRGDKLMGTAFAISLSIEGTDQSHMVLVTAKHCLEEIPRSIETVRLRFNSRDGGAKWIPTKRTDWIHNLKTDISVYIWLDDRDGNSDNYHFYTIPENMLATKNRMVEHGIGVGDEVITVGLFTLHGGRQRNHPIIRVGNIAAIPEDKIRTELYGDVEGYLVELRSIGGLSGSPVFVHLGGIPLPQISALNIRRQEGVPPARVQERTTLLVDDTIYLLGVMHGHFPLEKNAIGDTAELKKGSDKLNTGIGVVIPVDYILDLLKTKGAINVLQEEAERERARITPVMDSAENTSKEQFEGALRKVSKPISSPPDEGKKHRCFVIAMVVAKHILINAAL